MTRCEGTITQMRNFPARRDEHAPQKMLEGLQNLENTNECHKKKTSGQKCSIKAPSRHSSTTEST